MALCKVFLGFPGEWHYICKVQQSVPQHKLTHMGLSFILCSQVLLSHIWKGFLHSTTVTILTSPFNTTKQTPVKNKISKPQPYIWIPNQFQSHDSPCFLLFQFLPRYFMHLFSEIPRLRLPLHPQPITVKAEIPSKFLDMKDFVASPFLLLQCNREKMLVPTETWKVSSAKGKQMSPHHL